MKSHSILVLLLSLGFSLSARAEKPGQDRSEATATLQVSDKPVTPSVNEAVKKLILNDKLAGAVTLVAQNGKLLHLQAHGVQSLETGEPMTSSSIFRIHSMTKAIVSAAALQQLERGKYKLSDPVADYLPAFSNLTVRVAEGKPKPATKVMTIEDLFRHTSGLAYGFTAPPDLVPAYYNPKLWLGDLEQFCDVLATIPLVHEPGESWTYGVSTDVLGRLVEIWSGKNLAAYLEEELFTPLGMTDTGFWIENEKDLERFASPHQTSESGIAKGEDPLGQKYSKEPKLLSGGGGLVSTAPDYYQFLQMIADGGTRNGKLFLKPETVTMMTSNRLPDSISNIFFGKEQRADIGFGLGFSVATGPSKGWDEAAPIGEYGWGGAASCHYWVSPKDDNLIVITLEQTTPFNWNLERALKPLIYEAIRK